MAKADMIVQVYEEHPMGAKRGRKKKAHPLSVDVNLVNKILIWHNFQKSEPAWWKSPIICGSVIKNNMLIMHEKMDLSIIWG
jgi:hypothetical protein